ncbi:MAG: biphenyl 2,3-dioxygenase [Lysobacterales bacterium]|nr:MAG: biphenyl 2,3-dioxygenase [Xanthomonadales bacterium]
MKRAIIILTTILIGTVSHVFAAGDLSRNKPELIVLEMGAMGTAMYFKPNHLELETGKAYKLLLKNVDAVKHELDAAEFAEKIFTRKVEVKDEKGEMLAEIKGSVREIEVGPQSEVEWYIVPVQTGKNLEMNCALPGHKEAGMVGTITIN